MPLGVDKQYMKADAVTPPPGSPAGLLVNLLQSSHSAQIVAESVEGKGNEAPVIKGYGLNGKTSSQCLYTREPGAKLAS